MVRFLKNPERAYVVTVQGIYH